MTRTANVDPGKVPGQHAAIAAVGVTKRFPGVLANDNVDFRLHRGEVHTLLGENGAGKSTLAAMLCGLYQPDEGHIELSGARVALSSPRDGLSRGIGMVHQHFRLVGRFTVAENVVLGDPNQAKILAQRDIEKRVSEIGEQFGLPIDASAPISRLTVGQRQRVEIVKMLYRGVEVLLLDEPTAVLTPQEVDTLFDTVRRMAAAGKSIVFISHKLREVMAISDRVTVMRAGAVTGEVLPGDTDERGLAELMVGRPVQTERRRGSELKEAALVADALTVSSAGQQVLSDVSLRVRSGEILGIAGVSGNGQRPLARTLAGLITPDHGSAKIFGADIAGKGPRAARAAGLAFVPEDRLGTGLVPGMSITDNMILTRKRRFFVDRASARAEALEAIGAYDIKTPGTETAARVLSGGNSQKVLLARELASVGESTGPQVLIVSSPTRGLDVGAAEFVRGLLDKARSRGAAILIISEDLEEVRSISDRVAVLYQGRVVLSGSTDSLELDEIGLAMAGVVGSAEASEGASSGVEAVI